MTRATAALLRYLFEDKGLNRVEIHCSPENIKSCAVAERLGFQKEGLSRQAQLGGGRFLDDDLFALLSDGWEAKGRPR